MLTLFFLRNDSYREKRGREENRRRDGNEISKSTDVNWDISLQCESESPLQGGVVGGELPPTEGEGVGHQAGIVPEPEENHLESPPI